MKYLNHSITTVNTSFIQAVHGPENGSFLTMELEDSGTNLTLNERIDGQDEALLLDTEEAQVRSAATASFAGQRFDAIASNFIPDQGPDIEEKVHKAPKKNLRTSQNNLEVNQNDDVEPDGEADLDVLHANLGQVEAGASEQLRQADADKVANNELVTAQVDAAMTNQIGGAENGVAEGGQDVTTHMG